MGVAYWEVQPSCILSKSLVSAAAAVDVELLLAAFEGATNQSYSEPRVSVPGSARLPFTKLSVTILGLCCTLAQDDCYF
jgi:hypothetical protein